MVLLPRRGDANCSLRTRIKSASYLTFYSAISTRFPITSRDEAPPWESLSRSSRIHVPLCPRGIPWVHSWGTSGARCLAVGRILSYARGGLHVLYYSPKTVSVRAHQSPYIGDEDALTESPLAFSVCSLAPSRGDRYRAS